MRPPRFISRPPIAPTSPRLPCSSRRLGWVAPTLAIWGALLGCGDREVGEARLTWSMTSDEGETVSRTIHTWALLAETGSRHGERGRLLHIDVPVPSAGGETGEVHGRLQLDLPLRVAGAELEGRYVEMRGDAILFDGRLSAGAMTATGEDDGQCSCLGGAFSLTFVDAGPDGKRETDDDLSRRIQRAHYTIGGGACSPPSPPVVAEADEGVVFRVDQACAPVSSAGSGGGPQPRPSQRSVPSQRSSSDRGRRSRGSTTVVVVAAPPPSPSPAPRSAGSGCSGDDGGGCQSDDRDSGCGSAGGSDGGCAGDDRGGGCSSDDDPGDSGCSGDGDDSGGCSGDDDDAGCAGDRAAAGRHGAGLTAPPQMCRKRRPGLPSGTQSGVWMALALLWTGHRDGRRRAGDSDRSGPVGSEVSG